MNAKQNIANLQYLQLLRVEFLLQCGCTSYEASQDEFVNYFSDRIIEIDATIPVGVLNPNV